MRDRVTRQYSRTLDSASGTPPKVIPARKRRASSIKYEDSSDSDEYQLEDSDTAEGYDNMEEDAGIDNIYTPTIKQEQENGKHNMSSLLNEKSSNTQDSTDDAQLPDPDNPDFYCRVCKRGYGSLGKYRTHCRGMHKIKLKPLVGLNKDNLHITPDEDDPNNYCRSCEKTLPTRSTYRTHLKNVHKMKIKPVLKAMHVVADAKKLPEIDDPNFHCRVCDKTFDSRKYYRHHITFVHRIMLFPKKDIVQDDPNILPDENDPDNYCQVCDIFLSSPNNFCRHLTTIHRMTINKPEKVLKKRKTDKLPSVDDPNNHCNVCDMKLTNQHKYRTHLRRIHKMTLTPLKSDLDCIQHITPDIDDPDFYCRVCDRFFDHSHGYRGHLRSVHRIQTVSINGSVPNLEIQPDINDPNNYCKSCDRSFNKSGNYNRHLRDIHKCLPHTPQSTKNPNIIPDLRDPNNYCKSCDKSYANRDKYSKHLKSVHQLPASSTTRMPVYDPNYKADINDQKNRYCFTCKTIYTTRQRYKSHMNRAHKDNNNTPVFNPTARVDPNIEPDIDDPDFRCASCNYTYRSKAAYYGHLKGRHKIVIARVRPKMDPNIVPDIYNPDYYCTSCNFTFKKRSFFVYHLRKLHNMFVPKPLPQKRVSKKYLPNDDDKNDLGEKKYKKSVPTTSSGFHCDTCDSNHVSKQYLVIHMKKIHNTITTALLVNCRPKFGIQPETQNASTTTFCKSCNYTFDSALIYQRHLIDLHGLSLDSPPTLDGNVQMIISQYEIDDASAKYCKICDHAFCDHRALVIHFRDFHAIEVTVPTRNARSQKNCLVLPNLDDPNSHCRSCIMDFVARFKYCQHLRGAHGIIAKNPHDLTVPNYNDPNFYCNSCKIRHTTHDQFRNHLIMHHNYPGQVVEEDDDEEEEGDKETAEIALPDANDPNFHCQICKFTYTARITFQKHLVAVHKMHVPRIGKYTLSKNEIEPGDIVDFNAFCRSCNLSFSTLGRYRHHVRIVHNMITPKTIHSVNVENRCIECNITFVSKDYHGKHMEQFHNNLVPAVVKMEEEN